MKAETIHEWLYGRRSVWIYLLLVAAIASAFLILKTQGPVFTHHWDFRVYLQAKETLRETGSPYFDRESLRFIYPPSAIFFLPFIYESSEYQSIYLIIVGTLWFTIVALFCRKNIHLLVLIPVFLFIFGKQGYVTAFAGNLAPILYFVAAAGAFLYFQGRISSPVFALLLLLLILIKPFYAEFLIFIWFLEGFRRFIFYAVAVVAAFFAINFLFFPSLIFEFLAALKVDNYDTEIFGITMLSHLVSLSFSETAAALLHFTMIGFCFFLFAQRYASFGDHERICGIFILACLINPKHITYDLMVMVPALVVLLLEARARWCLAGLAILMLVSTFDFGLASQPYFQWWYGFLAAFLLSMIARKPTISLKALAAFFLNPVHFRRTTQQVDVRKP